MDYSTTASIYNQTRSCCGSLRIYQNSLNPAGAPACECFACLIAAHSAATGRTSDDRQFETLYESLDPDNVLESAILDKGYDADRIRERLSYDGIQPVIPPISTGSKKLHYNKELYRNRNLIERFFNKIKHFRRIATRYDKLRKSFFAALHLVAAFIMINNS